MRLVRVTQAVAVVLLVGWVALLVATVVQGHRTSSYSDLTSAVRSGDATDVEVSPGLRPRTTNGDRLVEIRWRDGLVRYTTSVLEVRGRQGGSWGDGTSAVLRRPVPDALRALDPGLEIAPLSHPGVGLGVSAKYLGWEVPGRPAAAYVALLLATLVLLAVGPEPRRVTPWGWFWLLLLTGPIGAIAFLVLSGVLSRKPVAAPMGPRTGGGWALILALALSAVTGG